MHLLCKIAGHAWRSGYCRRRKCGAIHQEHQWEQMPGKCAQRCSICGITQDTPHQWQAVSGKCVEKCTICGKESSLVHTWERLGCALKCSVCGAKGEPHLWVNHQCGVCGVYDQAVLDLLNSPYVNVVGDSDAQKLLDDLSQKTLVEIAVKAKCGHVCHAAKDRVCDPVLLAQIAEASDNKFIINELKKKFICPHCGGIIDAVTLSHCKCQVCGGEVHDFYTIQNTKIDRADFTCGTCHDKCKRCGKETDPKEFSHYGDGH